MSLPLVTDENLDDIRRHAEEQYPREACGLLIDDLGIGRRVYVPCRNNAARPDMHFIMNQTDQSEARKRGAVAAVVHSHPDAFPYPSEADIVHCNRSNLPWFIVGVQAGVADPQLHGFLPVVVRQPYEGRQFVHGVQDCYQLIKDYYAQEFSITLTDYHREDGWWEAGSQSMYEENFEKEGFFSVSLDNIQVGDMIVMQVRAPVPNHAAIYLGNEMILHHLYGRLSTKEIYSPFWQKQTVYIKRHRGRA